MKKLIRNITTLVIVIVVLGIGYFAYSRYNSAKNNNYDGYYAVALDTGEVFFGKIASKSGSELELNDVYYLTFSQNGDSTKDATTSPSPSASPTTQPVIIDTNASDAIAPTDVYKFNMSHVKYYYPLNSDSQVIKTIKDHKG